MITQNSQPDSITISFMVPAPSGAGTSLQPTTFLAYGSAKGNTMPISEDSTATLLTARDLQASVPNGSGRWMAPPAGFDWAFEFTDVQHLNTAELFLLHLHLVDGDGNTGEGTIPVYIDE